MSWRATNIIFLILICLLAGSTAYFYLRSQDKLPRAATNTQPAATNTVTTPVTPATTPSAPSTPAVASPATPDSSTAGYTKPAAASKRPSNPTETYTLLEGETLFSVGRKLNLTWTTLTAVNNITDADKVKTGQILIIPSSDPTTKKLTVEFQVDNQRAAAIQQQAASQPTYLDPVTVAKTDSPPIYGLVETDTFTLEARDDYAGSATVTAVHGDKTYRITLLQPVTKGKDGIWAITRIQPTS